MRSVKTNSPVKEVSDPAEAVRPICAAAKNLRILGNLYQSC